MYAKQNVIASSALNRDCSSTVSLSSNMCCNPTSSKHPMLFYCAESKSARRPKDNFSLNYSSSLSLSYVFFFFFLPFASFILFFFFKTKYFKVVSICVVLSSISFFVTFYIIPAFMYRNAVSGLLGYDLAKKRHNEREEKKEKEDVRIPESLGLVCGIIYLLACILCQTFFSGKISKLLEYNAGLLSICFMTFLGFADDVLDLPWRYKMTLPFFASLPILVAYSGNTSVLLPKIMQKFTQIKTLNLGIFYHFYMSFLTVFCTNSINIYAGLNGLEVGQSLVMCIFIVLHNILEISENLSISEFNGTSSTICEQHLFSLLLSIPFFSTSLGLCAYNWYPSKVFVGDTFTFFSGIYFAVVGILGHFSKTLIFFFIPQILNFFLSLPQLAGVIPCPKHRVPRLNVENGKLHSSGNYTLPNLFLKILGPKYEDTLVKILIIFQIFCCTMSLIMRHFVFY